MLKIPNNSMLRELLHYWEKMDCDRPVQSYKNLGKSPVVLLEGVSRFQWSPLCR